jgi:hypothetical protein
VPLPPPPTGPAAARPTLGRAAAERAAPAAQCLSLRHLAPMRSHQSGSPSTDVRGSGLRDLVAPRRPALPIGLPQEPLPLYQGQEQVRI